MSTFTELWLDFEKTALPPQAGPMERRSHRIAFCAGSIAMLKLLARASDQGIGSHDDLLLMAADWEREVKAMVEDIRNEMA